MTIYRSSMRRYIVSQRIHTSTYKLNVLMPTIYIQAPNLSQSILVRPKKLEKRPDCVDVAENQNQVLKHAVLAHSRTPPP